MKILNRFLLNVSKSTAAAAALAVLLTCPFTSTAAEAAHATVLQPRPVINLHFLLNPEGVWTPRLDWVYLVHTADQPTCLSTPQSILVCVTATGDEGSDRILGWLRLGRPHPSPSPTASALSLEDELSAGHTAPKKISPEHELLALLQAPDTQVVRVAGLENVSVFRVPVLAGIQFGNIGDNNDIDR